MIRPSPVRSRAPPVPAKTARASRRRDVPFVFATGCAAMTVPAAYAVPHHQKQWMSPRSRGTPGPAGRGPARGAMLSARPLHIGIVRGPNRRQGARARRGFDPRHGPPEVGEVWAPRPSAPAAALAGRPPVTRKVALEERSPARPPHTGSRSPRSSCPGGIAARGSAADLHGRDLLDGPGAGRALEPTRGSVRSSARLKGKGVDDPGPAPQPRWQGGCVKADGARTSAHSRPRHSSMRNDPMASSTVTGAVRCSGGRQIAVSRTSDKSAGRHP